MGIPIGYKMKMSTVEISVLLPILNEKDNLVPLTEEILKALSPLNKNFEIIMVDDGSRDGSRQVIQELSKNHSQVKGLFFRANRGQTAAFDAGFRAASGNIIVTMDADRQNDPADIPKMLQLLDQGYDFISGWRKNRKDGFLLRKIPSRIANWLIRLITKTKIHDLGCSLKCYKKEITEELRLYGEMHRFIGPLCEMNGAQVGEIEVHHRPRVAGESKYNLSRTFKVLLDLTTIWFLRKYETKPIYVFGGIGFSLIFGGGLTWAWVLYEKYFWDIWVHRNPLFIIGTVLLILGAQFVALGLLAELIIRTYFEAQNRRPYSISKKIGFD